EGLNKAYGDANERVAKAQGQLQAIKDSVAAGKLTVRAKDDPTLADIEQRASALREQWRDLQRRFTPAYLALDSDAVALQARLANLEQQLKEQRIASQQAAIADAQGELSSAQASSDRLRKDLEENQKGARDFAARLAQFKVMQDDLDHLQSMERAVTDRSTKLQSSVRERAPRVQLVEAAAPSLVPWRPDYPGNALIALAGSLIFGLFATWFVEFLRGPAQARSMLVHHSLALPAMDRYASPALRAFDAQQPEPAQISAPEPPPRELDSFEIGALIANGSDDLRLAAAALLSGLSPEEIVALRWDQIDFASSSIHIGGPFGRNIPLQETFALLLEQRRHSAREANFVLHNGRGDPLTIEGLDRVVLYAAYDASLDRASEVTAATLRYAYLLFLLRQGIRATDIGRIAGHIPQHEMIAYMQLASSRTRLPLEQIDVLHPALRPPRSTLH
ncbi:MAG TPA: tyrosine-type recombinase/integrase, partial [Micropepsaceae bacterium]|nr:tyrosine-type recombinase/integrase [Micropepsaceae bacterium]